MFRIIKDRVVWEVECVENCARKFTPPARNECTTCSGKGFVRTEVTDVPIELVEALGRQLSPPPSPRGGSARHMMEYASELKEYNKGVNLFREAQGTIRGFRFMDGKVVVAREWVDDRVKEKEELHAAVRKAVVTATDRREDVVVSINPLSINPLDFIQELKRSGYDIVAT